MKPKKPVGPTPAETFANQILNLMMKPSKRDLQVQIGPSNIGDPCDRCLAMAMAGKLPDGPRAAKGRFNLLAWQGTAVHTRFQDTVEEAEWPGVHTERKVSIGKVKGYGKVSGSIDIYSENAAAPLDYKVRYKAVIRKYKALGKPPVEMLRQVSLYGYGCEREGLPVREFGLILIPRDSMDPRDIWVYTQPYERRIAKEAIERAERIWRDYVVTGRIDLLRSHRECFNCNSFARPDLTFFKGTDKD